MEEKKGIKVSLTTVILLFFVFILVVALVGMWYYYNNLNQTTEVGKNDINNESNAGTQNSIVLPSEETTSKNSYEEITREFEGIDCLYVTEVVKENNLYTLKGIVYTQYTISYLELNNAVQNGYFNLNNEKYTIKQSNDSDEYDLYSSNFDEYALYKFKRLNSNEYYLECQAQISDVWKLTDKHMQITVDSSTLCTQNFSYEEGDVTVKEVFDNYEKHTATETTNPVTDTISWAGQPTYATATQSDNEKPQGTPDAEKTNKKNI